MAVVGRDAWIVAGPRYVLMASPINPDATNLPVRATFVPWVGSVLTERLVGEPGQVISAAPVMAAMANAGIAGAARFGGRYLQLLPRGVVDSITPPPGIGHTEGSRGYYKIETYTTTTSGARYVATMTQRGDPGYAATAVMMGESAITLACQRDRLSDRRGVLTPVAAMGDALLARLPAAGVAINIARLS